jgi:ribosomal protein S18 acetylase RimI-like enzyme
MQPALWIELDRRRRPTNTPLMQRLAEALIVPAGPGDADALAKLHVETWRETYVGLLPAGYLGAMDVARHARRWRTQLAASVKPAPVLVAEQRRGLVGYCAGGQARDADAEVFTLYVLRKAQGGGLGAALLGDMARVLKAGGARSLHLWVLASNIRAQAFYQHLGGTADRSRPVAGWGGGLTETRYVWPAIEALADRD